MAGGRRGGKWSNGPRKWQREEEEKGLRKGGEKRLKSPQRGIQRKS